MFTTPVQTAPTNAAFASRYGELAAAKLLRPLP
jgi:hypothetical protein